MSSRVDVVDAGMYRVDGDDREREGGTREI